MQLKQICNHPAQYLARRDVRAGGQRQVRAAGSCCASRSPSGRRRCSSSRSFSRSRSRWPTYLADGLRPRRAGAARRHAGRASGRELVRRFQDERGPPFFVISLKAGGSGLNLTAASHVIHFDRWWNPAVENQATDRAFRIGQKRNVLVHKFVCRGTVEERIDAMIRDKQAVADQLLQPGERDAADRNERRRAAAVRGPRHRPGHGRGVIALGRQGIELWIACAATA